MTKAALALVGTLVACGGTEPAPGAAAVAARSAPGAQAAGEACRDDLSCILPWGPNLNEVLDTDLGIITGEGGCDPVIAAHHRWAQLLLIFFNSPGGSPEVPLVYPPGYTPSHPDPMQDFLARLESATYVLQPSGRTFTFTARQLRDHFYPSTLGAIFGPLGIFPTTWNNLRVLVMLPPLPPLQPGSYSVGMSVTFKDMWCDGTSADVAADCFPAGTSFQYSRDFTAVCGD